MYFVPGHCLLIGSFSTSLPGHEGLQHSHVLLGEVVLSNNVFQGMEVARDHEQGLDLVLTLSIAEDSADGQDGGQEDREQEKKEKCDKGPKLIRGRSVSVQSA